MIFRAIFMVFAIAGPATAHPGHLDTLAGHDHVSAGILIGIAIAIGLLGALGKSDEEETDEPEGAEA